MAPRNDGAAGRGRSVGSCKRRRRRAAAASRSSCFVHASLPGWVCRCQRAKSAYWMGGSASGEGRPGGERLVQCHQLGQEHAIERDAVEDDVVQGQEQPMPGVGQAYQVARTSGPLLQIKRPPASSVAIRRLPPRAPPPARSKIHDRQRDGGRRLDHLVYVAVDDPEDRAPRLVTTEDLRQASLESADVQAARVVDRDRLVVDGFVQPEVCVEPELPLRERHGGHRVCASARDAPCGSSEPPNARPP